jgi:hypothetical protein
MQQSLCSRGILYTPDTPAIIIEINNVITYMVEVETNDNVSTSASTR